MAFLGAIFRTDGDDATGCQVLALFIELLGRAREPAPAEEKNDGGAIVGRFVLARLEEVQFKLGVIDPFINQGLVWLGRGDGLGGDQ